MPILRWGRAIRELQDAAALGAFGDGLRLYQQQDGSLQLVESVATVDNAFAHTIAGNKLYPVISNFEGEPVTVGGGLNTDDPPPFVELTEEEMMGPTIGYVWSRRDSALDLWQTPAVFRYGLTLPEVESDAVEFIRLVALVRYGQVLTLNT